MNPRVLYLTSSRKLVDEVSRAIQLAALEVDHASGLAHAAARLRNNAYGAILTEASVADATWREILEHVRQTGLRCAVVVTDRLADDELWAEVLDAGAYDLLPQPFEPGEVRRVLSAACGESAARHAVPRPAI